MIPSKVFALVAQEQIVLVAILVLGVIVMEFVRKRRTSIFPDDVITNTVTPMFLVPLMILAKVGLI